MKKLAVLLLLVIFLAGCAPAQVGNAAPVKVFFAGENGSVKTALDLAVRAGTITLVSDMAQADALALDGVIPPGAAERARAGAGVVLILGAGVTAEQASELLGQTVTLTAVDDAISLKGAEDAQDALLREIAWNGAPQVRERFDAGGLDARALVSAFEEGEGILYEVIPARARGRRHGRSS